MSRRPLTTREDDLEQVLARRHETAPAVEVHCPPVGAGDDDLQRGRALRDRIALRILEQLPADALSFVPRADEELLDPHGGTRTDERDVTGGATVHVRDEDGLLLEHRKRPPVGPAIEPGQTEQERLVRRLEGTDLGLSVRQCAIALSTASCSSGDNATVARPRSSCLT